jgi:hypothetical protein
MADEHAPGAPTRMQRFAAMRHAAFAARRKWPATRCPYDPGSTDDSERVLARVWVGEYLRILPTPIDVLEPLR